MPELVVNADERCASVEVDLRWRDLDPLGHVNYAGYLTLMEEARDLLVKRWLDLSGGEDYVVVKVDIDYLRELKRTDEPVRIELRATHVGTRSVAFHESVLDGHGELTARAQVTIVMWDTASGGSRPLTSFERERLEGIRSEPEPAQEA